jgi:hypothetical protein
MSHRLSHLAVAAAAGLAAGAAPALATEGPPGAPLPNALAPVTIVPAPPSPAVVVPRARPAVLRARLLPRHVKHGRRARLQLRLSASGRVRVVVERTRHGRHTRVAARTVKTHGRSLTLRLRKLRAGRYRVTVVAIDGRGMRSRAVHRALVVRR